MHVRFKVVEGHVRNIFIKLLLFIVSYKLQYYTVGSSNITFAVKFLREMMEMFSAALHDC